MRMVSLIVAGFVCAADGLANTHSAFNATNTATAERLAAQKAFIQTLNQGHIAKRVKLNDQSLGRSR